MQIWCTTRHATLACGCSNPSLGMVEQAAPRQHWRKETRGPRIARPRALGSLVFRLARAFSFHGTGRCAPQCDSAFLLMQTMAGGWGLGLGVCDTPKIVPPKPSWFLCNTHDGLHRVQSLVVELAGHSGTGGTGTRTGMSIFKMTIGDKGKSFPLGSDLGALKRARTNQQQPAHAPHRTAHEPSRPFLLS